MASLRNSTPRKAHKERAQPKRRSHLGLLEKKKDYKLRAKDFHSKEKRIRVLREKAALRNPDEFNKKMIHSRTVDGKHVAERSGTALGADEMRILRTQDVGYVQTKLQAELKKVERLRILLQLNPVASPIQSISIAKNKKKPQKPNHTVFVDDADEVDSFSLSEFFNTPNQLLHRRYNRPTFDQLKSQPLVSTIGTSSSSSSSSSSTSTSSTLNAAISEWDFDEDDLKDLDLSDSDDDDDIDVDDSDIDDDDEEEEADTNNSDAQINRRTRLAMARMEKQRNAQRKELDLRLKRVQALRRVLNEMELKRKLLGKGRIDKIKRGGKEILRWKPERKR